MAGTLVANTINTDTGLFSTNNAYSGIAKAWLNYNGVTQTVNASFNVSSVTYNGTGDYTMNFATAMPNATYAVTFGGTASSGSTRLYNYACIAYDEAGAGTAPTTSAVRVRTGSTAGNGVAADYRNVPYLYIVINGA